MLLYLDTNLIRYYAEYRKFILEDGEAPHINTLLLTELKALKKIIELEQLGEGWHVAAPKHLLHELQQKHESPEDREVYSILSGAWLDVGHEEVNETSEESITTIEHSLYPYQLKAKDRRHLAEAIALGAVWFLTNDKRLVNHTRPGRNKKCICRIQGVLIARPSECLPEISKGLFLRAA